MAKVYLDDTTLTGIANQTRRLTKTQDTYTPSEMITALSTVETGGTPQLNIIPITENMDFNNLAIPENMEITLEKNILDYFTPEEKAEIEQQHQEEGYASYSFFQDIVIPYVDEEEEPPENRVAIYELSFSLNESNIYEIVMDGVIRRAGYNDSNEYYITFSSLDGINFFISNFGVLYYDYDSGAEYSVISPKMEFPVTLNFSEMINGSEDAKGWNDLLSEFLFTIQE